jgi:uncharacterized membrane protein
MSLNHKTFIKISWFCSALLLSCFLAGQATAQPPKSGGGGGSSSISFNIVALDLAPSFAWDISQKLPDGSRLIAGSVDPAGNDEYRAACWVLTGSGSQTQIARLLLADYGSSGAAGVSVSGAIVGSGRQLSGQQQVGFYWNNRNSLPVELPGLPDEAHSFASNLNSAGIVIGGSSRLVNGTSELGALAWLVNQGVASSPVLLPSLFPAGEGEAAYDLVNAISEIDAEGHAVAVGMSSGVPVAWLLTHSSDGQLTTSAAPMPLDAQGEANGVNQNGAVCGHDVSNAVIWDGATKKILSWDSNTFLQRGIPTGISANQSVVGYGRERRTSREQAVFWASPTAAMLSLDRFLPRNNSPFTYLKYASAINDDREIVGYGWHSSSGVTRAFLAVPK